MPSWSSDSGSASQLHPLPISWRECRQRGWNHLDVLLVSGDAYIDHPSFGVALIARLLEDHGYLVAVLPQPRYDSALDFLEFPPPRLFCGITAGNLDSIVANYTGNGKVRATDAYSPGGSPWRTAVQHRNNRYRPDRATIIYANLARAAFPKTPIILGGVEASLRRFVHFDYQQNKLRSSLLTDAKADLLLYGMAEKAVLEVARRCEHGEPLTGIDGSCERLTEQMYAERQQHGTATFKVLPSYDEIIAEPARFLAAELAVDRHCRADSPVILSQKQQSHWLIQHPAPPPLTSQELDRLYELPYSRMPHPATPDIPAYAMIKDSITIVRGCSGNCSFCAITRHQGARVQSRSVSSIVRECSTVAAHQDFRGTITDLGGPTANLFGTSCAIGTCSKKDCLYPKLCNHLLIDEDMFLQLLREVGAIDKISHLFISSGLRMELLLRTPTLLKTLLARHVPGAMKIAPEHTADEVLELMHKEPHALLEQFVFHCRKVAAGLKKNIQFVPYVISAHPGCTEHHARQLVEAISRLDLSISKFQDFTPTPGTISTAMYVSGCDRAGRKIYVARNTEARMRQRRIIEQRFHRAKKQFSAGHLAIKKPYRKA